MEHFSGLGFSFNFTWNLLLTTVLILLWFLWKPVRTTLIEILHAAKTKNLLLILCSCVTFYLIYLASAIGLSSFQFYGTTLEFYPFKTTSLHFLIDPKLSLGTKAILLWDHTLLDVHGDLYPITGYDGSWYYAFNVSAVFILFPAAFSTGLSSSVLAEYLRVRKTATPVKRGKFLTGLGILGALLTFAGFVLNTTNGTRAACSNFCMPASIAQRLFGGSVVIEGNLVVESIRYLHLVGLALMACSMFLLQRRMSATVGAGHKTPQLLTGFKSTMLGILMVLLGVTLLIMGTKAFEIYQILYSTVYGFGAQHTKFPMLADFTRHTLKTIISMVGYGIISLLVGAHLAIRSIMHRISL